MSLQKLINSRPPVHQTSHCSTPAGSLSSTKVIAFVLSTLGNHFSSFFYAFCTFTTPVFSHTPFLPLLFFYITIAPLIPLLLLSFLLEQFRFFDCKQQQ